MCDESDESTYGPMGKALTSLTSGALKTSGSLLKRAIPLSAPAIFRMDKLTTFSLIGLALSLYAVYVEMKKEADSSFEAVCDISETMSCSKVFLSEQGKIWSFLGIIPKGSVLDQPNAVYGAAFYVMVMILDSVDPSVKSANSLLMFLSTFGAGLSAYLAKILVYDLQDTCLVCFGSYVCNAVILFGASRRFFLSGNNRGLQSKGLSHSSIDDIYKKSKEAKSK